MRILALSVLFVFSLAGTARAQNTATASVAELTVDDQRPPDRYRDLLATGLQPTLRPVLQCYLDRLAQVPSAQGSLRLRLWVSARQVIRATEEASTLGDDAFDECARAAVRTFRLPDAAPEGGAAVRFTLYFSRNGLASPPLRAPGEVFATADASIPVRAPTPATPPPTPTPTPPPPAPEPAARAAIRVDSVRGGLEADAILAAIPPAAFDACPAGAGERALTLSISRTGTVRATAGRGTLRQRDVFQCVMRTVRAVRMPAARPATRATITVTLSR